MLNEKSLYILYDKWYERFLKWSCYMLRWYLRECYMMREQMIYVEIIYDELLIDELILWLYTEKRGYAWNNQMACDMQNDWDIYNK